MSLFVSGFSQQLGEVRFAYDANGNRITRSLEFKKVWEEDRNVERESLPHGRVSDSIGLTEVSVYPNPTFDKVFVRIENGAKGASYRVSLTNISGAKLSERNMSGGIETLDLSGQAAGVYFLELTTADERHVWKVIKK